MVGFDYSHGLDVREILDRVSVTADVTINGSSGAQTTIITGNSIIYNGLTLVEINFYCSALFSGNQTVVCELFRDSTSLGRIVQQGLNQANPVFTSFFETPSSGAHTYTVKGWVTGGTAASAAATSPFAPMTLVVKA